MTIHTQFRQPIHRSAIEKNEIKQSHNKTCNIKESEFLNKAIQKVKNMSTELKEYPLFHIISSLVIAAAGAALILPIVTHKGLKSLTPGQQKEITRKVR